MDHTKGSIIQQKLVYLESLCDYLEYQIKNEPNNENYKGLMSVLKDYIHQLKKTEVVPSGLLDFLTKCESRNTSSSKDLCAFITEVKSVLNK